MCENALFYVNDVKLQFASLFNLWFFSEQELCFFYRRALIFDYRSAYIFGSSSSHRKKLYIFIVAEEIFECDLASSGVLYLNK